ncbi:MAG TPA: FG-GAP-like repeat-containing protein [Pyrinomonadaceae bacterium]|nr:FG-GAP-like repeat-containing protein [Pyrinomonadaceae bacterium]
MKKLFFLTLLTVYLFSISDLQAQTRGWGFNSNGALGIGNAANQPAPQTVTTLPDATGAGIGIDHTLFLRANGTLAVAGLNEFGQFGSSTPASSNTPVAVPGLANVVQASGGGFHSAALLADGTVWSWGYNLDGQIGNGTTNTTGCLCVSTPTQTTITGVVQIEAGAFHTLALKSDGTVWAWGANDNGQLGDGSTTARPTPVQVGSGVSGFTNIIAVSAGDGHSIALKSDGTVWVWGSNEYGQIGNGTASTSDQLTPVQNTTLSNVTQIAAGIYHNLALNSSGKVFVWGDNFYGQVGNGAANNTPQSTPVQNTTLDNVIEIETAGFTNYVRLRGGAVHAWGINDVGQIGNGTTNTTGCTCQSTPVQTSVAAGNTGIIGGWFHAFALKPNFSVSTGTSQIFRGDNVRLTFAEITGAGNVAYTAIDPASVAGSYTLPSGYTIQGNQPAYDVTATATSTGNIDVCIAGINEFNPAAFPSLKVLHGEGSAWVDRTISSDFSRRQICARVNTLSPFVIAQGPPFSAPRAPYDFDGDGKTDVGIFRESDGSWWYVRSSDSAFRVYRFGVGTDIITPGDFTGDGKADIAIWRPSTGFWFIQRSEDNSFFSFGFGATGDIPAPADYDGDGKTDAAVFRPASATWFILNSGGSGVSIVTFGSAEDKPVPADYDGDGKADIAIFRPSDGSWWYLQSSNAQFKVYRFGVGTDKPVQGDYSGDGKADIAVWRPSTGEWFIQRSEDNSFYSFPFGTTGDIPAPGDYDGDGRFDAGVFRPSTADWFVQRSTAGILITTFGTSGDRPIPNAFVP